MRWRKILKKFFQNQRY